jgi:hypothetical protein
MAVRNYGIDKGKEYHTITEGVGSATTYGVELNIDLAKITNKEDAVAALEALKLYILNDVYPPA